MIRSALTLAGIVLAMVSATAHASYRELCTSAPGSCEYTGPDAPVFAADVCRDSAGAVYAKGTAPCPSGSTAYSLKYGEVLDPLTGLVAAYMPLGLACDQAGLCSVEAPPGDAQAQGICCEWGVCVPLNEVLCNSPNSVAYWCQSGVTNQDGTVECFEGEPI